MSILLIVSGVFFSLIFIGFLIGFARNWCKSLVRFLSLLADFFISLFTSSKITELLIGKITNGTTLTIFNFSINFEEIVEKYVGTDLSLAMGTTEELAMMLISVVLNLVFFILMFLIISLLTLIIYWIVFLVIKIKIKDEKEMNNEQGSSFGLRVIGGIEGVFSSLILCFVFLVPCFGIISIYDKVLESRNIQDDTEVASALSQENFICGELYYDEDDDGNDKIDLVLQKYLDERVSYGKSFMGKLFSITRLDKLGIHTFEKLTVVEVDNEDVSFTNEVSIVADTYNLYRQTFVDNKFNFSSNESINLLLKMYKKAVESKFVDKYVENLIPIIANKWSNNETFLKISNPISDEYKNAFNDVLKIFSNLNNFYKIDENIEVIFETIKIINDNKLIDSIHSGDNIICYFRDNDKIIKEVILKISSTEEFKNNISQILSDLIEILYNKMIGDDKFVKVNSETQNVVTDWNTEAERLQNIVNEISSLYFEFVDSESEVEIATKLSEMGKIIDLSRESETISLTLKSFILAFIKSDKIDFGENNDRLKEKITSYINDKWDINENKDFSFEETFDKLETSFVAMSSILCNKSCMRISDFAPVLEVIVEDDDVKEIVTSVIDSILVDDFFLSIVDKDLISKYVKIDDVEYIAEEITKAFLDYTSKETLENDLLVIQKIIDMIKNCSSNYDQEFADEFIETISSSEAVMKMLKDAVNSDYVDDLNNLIAGIGEENIELFFNSINNSQTLSKNYKNILLKVLGKNS